MVPYACWGEHCYMYSHVDVKLPWVQSRPGHHTFEVDVHPWHLLFLLLIITVVIILLLLLLVLLPREPKHGSSSRLLIDQFTDVSATPGKVKTTFGDVERATSERGVLPTFLDCLGTLLLWNTQ